MSNPDSYRPEKPAALTDRTDEALMALACDGYSEAFGVLMKRYEVRLFNYLRRSIGNRGEAEDLFQETFLRVYQHRGQFRQDAQFRPWLYRIATNACNDRRKYLRRRTHASLDQAIGDDGTTLGAVVPDGQPGPTERTQSNELAALIDAAIAELPEKHRSVFVMARYEGLEYAEIADALEIPVGTVKSRMNKAVHTVMEKVEQFRK